MYENYIDKATKIRQGEEINSSNLQEYLTKILSIKGDIEISQFPNGFSNLTYLIKIDKDEFVKERSMPFDSIWKYGTISNCSRGLCFSPEDDIVNT